MNQLVSLTTRFGFLSISVLLSHSTWIAAGLPSMHPAGRVVGVCPLGRLVLPGPTDGLVCVRPPPCFVSDRLALPAAAAAALFSFLPFSCVGSCVAALPRLRPLRRPPPAAFQNSKASLNKKMG